MNIVLVGHVCIDHNTTEAAAYTSWGSSVLYMAHHLRAQHGIVPIVVSTYGPDMVNYLCDITMLPDRPDRAETMVYENDTRSLPRTWRAYKVEHAGEPVMTRKVTRALREADVVVVAPLLPNYSASYLQKLIYNTRPSALRVLCPQGYFREISSDGLVTRREFDEAPNLVWLFDLVIYSEEDHPKALSVARSWRQLAPNTQIVVTQGPGGATIIAKGGTRRVPTTPLSSDKIVDSVGCGDVFAITTAHQYGFTRDLGKAVLEAHKAASQHLLATPVK